MFSNHFIIKDKGYYQRIVDVKMSDRPFRIIVDGYSDNYIFYFDGMEGAYTMFFDENRPLQSLSMVYDVLIDRYGLAKNDTIH